jgi:hypothetical protein
MNARKLLRITIGTILALVVVWGGIYAFASISEPFDYLKDSAKQSAELRALVGEVRSVRLVPWKTFSFNYSDVDGSAEFSGFIEGSRSEGELRARLIKKNGRWNIQSASFNSRSVQLD